MTGLDAVTPGTSLPQHARSLTQAREAFLSGGRPVERPRPVVSRSWSRGMRQGLDPTGGNERSVATSERVERMREVSELHLVIDDLRQIVSSVADASHMLLVIADAEGVVLWRQGSPQVRHQADTIGFREGSIWTEQLVGTNAIGTALAECAPVQLFSAEHFEQQQHPWYCTASPIHDPRTGDLLGVVDVSGPAMTLHPAIGALVNTAVRLAESQLWLRHERSLDRLRSAAAPRLAGLAGPGMLVDKHGWVAHTVGVAAAERVAAPRAERPLTIPGLGMCLPEPVNGGWLLRPRSGTEPLDLHLRLDGVPVLTVTGPGEPWQARLTNRHAEILLLLDHAGSAGLTAAQLSRALYGDDEHVMTVRAEVSRLRRVLGTIVATKPYRLDNAVRFAAETPPNGSPWATPGRHRMLPADGAPGQGA